MKKFLIITAIIAAFGASIWGYFDLKSSAVSKQVDVYTSIPKVPLGILSIKNIDKLCQSLSYNNQYWHDISKIDKSNKLFEAISAIDSIKDTNANMADFISKRQLLISFYTDSLDNIACLISAHIAESENTLLKDFLKQQFSDKLYFNYVNEIFVCSNQQDIFKASIKNINSKTSILNNDSSFTEIKNTAGKQAAANLCLNIQNSKRIAKKFFNKESVRIHSVAEHYAQWVSFDLDFLEDKIVLSGFATSGNNQDYLSMFKNQTAGANTLTNRMPYNTFFFQHFALSDFDAFLANVHQYQKNHGAETGANSAKQHLETLSGESPYLFFEQYFGGEIAYGCSPLDDFVIIKLFEPQAAKEKLLYMANDMGGEASVKKQYGYDIIHFNSTAFAGKVFGDYFTLNDEYLIISGDKLIIAPSAKFAQYIASRNSNTQTLYCAPNFKDADRTLLSESNYSMYANIPYIIRNANKFLNADKLADFEVNEKIFSNFSTFCLQAQNEVNNKSYQQFFVQYNKVYDINNDSEYFAKAYNSSNEVLSSEAVSEKENEIIEFESNDETNTETEQVNDGNIKSSDLLFKTQLDGEIKMIPQIVKNHYTGENEIAVQDVNNVLYLISAEGKILWKAELKEQIIGNITQVDMLKNRKLQMAFATKSKLYIVDRNGKLLKGYPINLKAQASAGLSVFDYDKTRNYRFFIPLKNGKIDLILAGGKRPKDFNFKQKKNAIDNDIQYFRIKSKDYLIAGSQILNRKGANRIKPKKAINRSNRNEFYSDIIGNNAHFITTNNTGQLYYIKTNGDVQIVSTNKYSKNHLFDLYENKDDAFYIYFDNNKLDVYDKDLNRYMSKEINSGSLPYFYRNNNLVAAYNTDSQFINIYNIDTKNIIDNSISTSSANYILSYLKPYKNICLVVCDSNIVKVYRVED